MTRTTKEESHTMMTYGTIIALLGVLYLTFLSMDSYALGWVAAGLSLAIAGYLGVLFGD